MQMACAQDKVPSIGVHLERRPLAQGFERSDGFLPGETSRWEPGVWVDNHRVDSLASPEHISHPSHGERLHCQAASNFAERTVLPLQPRRLRTPPPHTVLLHRTFLCCRRPGRSGRTGTGTSERTGIFACTVALAHRHLSVEAWDDFSGMRHRLFAWLVECVSGLPAHIDDHVDRLLQYRKDSDIARESGPLEFANQPSARRLGPGNVRQQPQPATQYLGFRERALNTRMVSSPDHLASAQHSEPPDPGNQFRFCLVAAERPAKRSATELQRLACRHLNAIPP